MSVTHQDVIDYLESHYNNTHYEVRQGKLHIKKWVRFDLFKHDELPSSMVFDYPCDLSDANIKILPTDLVLNSELYIFDTPVIVPILNVYGRMYIKDNDTTVLQCGTYISSHIRSINTKYDHLNRVRIGGYFFETGLLS